MPAKTYRSKPTCIEAMQWTGDNADEMYEWAVRPGDHPTLKTIVECFLVVEDTGDVEDRLGPKLRPMLENGCTAALWVDANNEWLGLVTGEWVAKDTIGFYPIKDEVFRRKYEEMAQ